MIILHTDKECIKKSAHPASIDIHKVLIRTWFYTHKIGNP